MASSSFSPAPKEVVVTKEQFYSFHHIDRELFSRLALHLGRDPCESAQVMAFWIWLEHAAKVKCLVSKVVKIPLPDALLDIMADETCMVLNVIQNGDFPVVFESGVIPHDIPLLQAVTNSGVSLKYFHDNRVTIIKGITLFLNDVCLRAFEDLYIAASAFQSKPVDPFATGIGLNPEPQNYARRFVLVNEYFDPFLSKASIFDAPLQTIGPLPPHPLHGDIVNNSDVDPLRSDPRVAAAVAAVAVTRPPGGPPPPEYLQHGFVDPYGRRTQRVVLNNDLGEMFSHLHLHEDNNINAKGCASGNSGGGLGDRPEDELSADDRTIFLTFSKGYPISENEVREFFTRKYGDVFEAIHMQEVQAEDQQSLYARLVVRSPKFIPVVLEGQSKVKFCINAKHVWARKYVRKSATG